MTNQIIGYLLIVLSMLLYMVSGAALVAMIYALTVNTTLAAIESAFGSLVIGAIFFALAKTSFRAGKKRALPNDESAQD